MNELAPKSSDGSSEFRFDSIAILIILTLYIIGLIIFLPKIQYPFGDSWAYSRNVYDAMESGDINFLEMQAALPILQVYLGVAVCKLSGGFAFWKLNLMTYVISCFAALYTFRFIRCLSRDSKSALLGTLLLIGMPPFFKMSLGFMTDIYFYFGMIFALYHAAKLLVDDESGSKHRHVLLASTGFVIGILSRTNALLTFIAYFVFLLSCRRTNGFKPLTWLYLVAPFIVLGFFHLWLAVAGANPYQAVLVQKIFLKDLYTSFTSSQFLPFVWGRIVSLAKWCGYFGVLLVPVSIWIMNRTKNLWRGGEEGRLERRSAFIIWFLLLPALIGMTLILVSLLPKGVMLPNTITSYGMGVKNVILPGAEQVLSAEFFQYAKSIIVIGGILLGLAVIGKVHEGKSDRGSNRFLWWMLIATSLFPLLTDIFSDRYLIPIFPILFAMFLGRRKAIPKLPGWVWVFPISLIFSTGLLAYEYFGWNTAKWEVVYAADERGEFELSSLLDEERAGALIDGGLEFTAFRYYSDEKFMDMIETQSHEGIKNRDTQITAVFLPGYSYWWNLPLQFDYYVRPPGFMPLDDEDPQVSIFRLVEEKSYRPFPWSDLKSLHLYKIEASPDTPSDEILGTTD